MLGHRRGQVVEPDLPGDATKELEGVKVATSESLECLTVGELQVDLSAVAFHQAKRVELSRSAVVDQCSEVAPVHIETFAGCRFDTNISASSHRALA